MILSSVDAEFSFAVDVAIVGAGASFVRRTRCSAGRRRGSNS